LRRETSSSQLFPLWFSVPILGAAMKPIKSPECPQANLGGAFSLDRITVEDLRKAMKLLSFSLSEDRLQAVTPLLNQTLEALQPLSKLNLPKELEPTSYLAMLRHVEKAKRPEDI